jgi:hypothetical protein
MTASGMTRMAFTCETTKYRGQGMENDVLPLAAATDDWHFRGEFEGVTGPGTSL